MSPEASTSGRSSSWTIFAGGLVIGGSLAVALTYTYATNLLENRSHSKRGKAIQRRVAPHALHVTEVSMPLLYYSEPQ